ncbi:hypothetical protein ACHAXS_001378 [Conticribra weissflogii]
MLNDINIFNTSPLLEWFLDGSFTKIEAGSMAIPFKLEGIKHPVRKKYSQFNKWQENTQKDIERIFGI